MPERANSEIPINLLEKLNEHTSGGFVLFYIDSNGSPVYLPYADNSAYLRALISYIQDISGGIRVAQKEEIVQYFLTSQDEEGDPL